MRIRKHHNNKGLQSVKSGHTARQVEGMARRILGDQKPEFAKQGYIPYDEYNESIRK